MASANQIRAACKNKARIRPPSAVNTTTQSATAILLTWSLIQEAEKYNIFVKEGLNFKYLTTTRDRRYTASGLQGGTNYTFVVTAISSDGVQSVQSTESTARTFANTNQQLSPPANVRAVAISSSSVRVSWSTANQAVKYNVFLKDKGSSNYAYKTTVNATTSVVISGLSRDVHEFAVTAIDGSGRQSARSSSAKANCTCVF